jgi:hypothetical protein
MGNMSRTIEQRFRQAILQLELCSHAPIVNLQGSHGTGKPGAVDLSGGDTGHTKLHNDYLACTSDRCRLEVTIEVEDTVKRLRRLDPKDRPTGETDEESRARILKDTRSWSPEDVARSHHAVTAKTIRRWRREARLNEETGLTDRPAKIDAEALVIDLWSRRICKTRNEIAQRVGLHHTSVAAIIANHEKSKAA